MLDAGPEEQGGGTRSDWLGMTRAPYTPTGHPLRALGHKVPQRTDLERPLGLKMAGKRKGVAPLKAEQSRRERDCSRRLWL
jgi:hypothetical protein